jgi:hypothetical protein
VGAVAKSEGREDVPSPLSHPLRFRIFRRGMT